MKHNLSPKVITDITTDVQKQYFRNSNHWWIKLINKTWWICLWIITIIFALFLIIYLNIIQKASFKNPITIISIILFVIAAFCLVQSFAIKNLLKKNTLNNLPITSYYQDAVTHFNPRLKIQQINQFWDLEPQGNLPMNEEPDFFNYCENVMIGALNGQHFNYGSILNQKVTYYHDTAYNYQAEVVDTSKSTSSYSRFVYYTTTVKNLNFTMTLKPRNFATKKFRSKNKVQLESNIFEDLFEVICDEQIKLRMLLEPVIMDKINNFCQNFKSYELPYIYLRNNQLTLSWTYDLGSNPYSSKGKIMVFPSTNNYDKFIDKLLTMISDDIYNLIQSQKWINNLGLSY